ncbi:hypothetical protein COCNU_08G000230 [Cocos nucifera]|uniref:Uncharacterized protein n=1 Tax=Cocos nucifera TaxID=13894 RepID=A0A8K0IH22_COCNU|nr:hypothetical protein COCNU_08G000230 [Cocos nucifera]
MKVGAPSFAAPTTTVVASEVATSAEVAPTTEVGTIGAGFMPPAPSSSSSGDQALELPTEGEIVEGNKKKKAIAKTLRKARPGEPSDDHGVLGEDPFNDTGIIRDLAKKFAMPEVVDRMADLDPGQLIWGSLGPILKSGQQMLIHIKRAHCQELKAWKVRRIFELRSIIFKKRPPRLNTLQRRR